MKLREAGPRPLEQRGPAEEIIPCAAWMFAADSEGCRSAFRTDVDHDPYQQSLGRTSTDGRQTVTYSFFDPEDVRLFTPTRFLWTLQTHDLIFNVFEEIFSREIGLRVEEWLAHRTGCRCDGAGCTLMFVLGS